MDGAVRQTVGSLAGSSGNGRMGAVENRLNEGSTKRVGRVGLADGGKGSLCAVSVRSWELETDQVQVQVQVQVLAGCTAVSVR